MAGGIEEQIFSDIESSTGTSFEPEDNNTDTQPPNQTGERNQQDHELDQVDQQLARRARPSLEEDVQNPLDQSKRPIPKKGQEKADQRATDEFGAPVGSKSNHVYNRLKSQLENQRQVATSYKTQVEHLTRQLAEVNVLDGLPKQLGLTNTDTADLLQLAAVLKANPTEGARKVIEIAISKGANLKDIVNDEFIPQLSLGATQRLLDERLGPIQKEREAKADVDSIDTEGRVQAHQFLADYPDAALHGDALADQMQKIEAEYASRGIKVSKYAVAEKAYNRIEQFCEKNGLDITQPLAPQLAARRSPSGDKRTPNRQSPRPIPMGSNGGGEVVSTRRQNANADDSFSSIVRESMVEAGYNFN